MDQEGEVLVIVEIRQVHDAEKLAAYQAQARQQIGPRGGAVLARGGETFEGDPPFGPLLVQRWPSAAAFRAWQESADYRPLIEIRRAAADLAIAIVPVP